MSTLISTPPSGDTTTPGGYIPGGDVSKFTAIASQREKNLYSGIKESIKHAWYNGNWDKSPYEEETVPNYTGYDYDNKYTPIARGRSL